jgi:hypothetical protein
LAFCLIRKHVTKKYGGRDTAPGSSEKSAAERVWNLRGTKMCLPQPVIEISVVQPVARTFSRAFIRNAVLLRTQLTLTAHAQSHPDANTHLKQKTVIFISNYTSIWRKGVKF